MEKRVYLVSALLVIIILAFSCKPQDMPKNEPFCGDNVCSDNEKESGCNADCVFSEGVTKLQCVQSGGSWNECGSPCSGTNAEYCIQVCSPQCECGGITAFKCPEGYKCRLSGEIADEIGVCLKE